MTDLFATNGISHQDARDIIEWAINEADEQYRAQFTRAIRLLDELIDKESTIKRRFSLLYWCVKNAQPLGDKRLEIVDNFAQTILAVATVFDVVVKPIVGDDGVELLDDYCDLWFTTIENYKSAWEQCLKTYKEALNG
jgi:hypothetical protein